MTFPSFPGLSWPGLTWPGVGASIPVDVEYSPPARSLAEVLAGSHTRLVSAAILTGPAAGAVLPVVAGNVTLIHDGPVRLSGSLTVAAEPEWTEQDADAALDPRAGVEIALAQGVRDDEGVEHWWQIGVVRPSRHAVNVSADAITVSVDVADRGAAVAHAAAPSTVLIASGSGILEGVQAALSTIAPWMPVDFPLEQDWTTDTDIVLAERAGDDLWAGCRAAVRNIGRLLTVDATGTAVAPTRTEVEAVEPIDVPMVAMTVEVDWEQAVHRVVARWTEARPEDADSEWQPQTGDVAVEDEEAIAALPENMPTTTRKYGGDESVLTSEPLARAAAAAELADLHDLIVSGSCETIPHPDVAPGAVIEVEGRRYRITQTSFDLAGGPVSVSLGNAARTLSVRLAERLGYRTGLERDEIVESLTPLMTRPIGGDTPLLVTPTDAVNGVEVGDVVRVVHDGAGRRVATGMISRKGISAKFSGETLGTVGGSPLTVDGSVQLRTRLGSNGTYQTFSGGDVTIPAPGVRIGTSSSYTQIDSAGNYTLPAPDLSGYALTTDLNSYTKKTASWELDAFPSFNITIPSAGSSWSQSWGNAIVQALVDIRAQIRDSRPVSYKSG